MREIEVKYRVHDLEALLLALKSLGIRLGDPVVQEDQAYAPIGWRFGDSKLGVSFLRLRTANGRHYFALKQPDQNEQACLEYETEIADRDAMHRAAMLMGFRPTVRIAKTRRVAALGDVTLCVDEVEGAGRFLEIERLAPDHVDSQAAQVELATLAESLGVPADRISETYDSLVHTAQRQL